MNTEIRIIHLCRGAIVEKQEGKKYFFATDYFDTLIAEEKKLSDTFCSIMNLDTDTGNGEITSAQSYTLYFSDKMYEKYEKKEQQKHNASPFENGKNLNFLSIIQVHITPEVLRRMEYKNGSLCKEENDIVLESYLDDLYNILDTYCKNNEEKNFVFRIYQVLSAGDFAVVVKSQYPETSFEISTEIRRRVAGKIGENGQIGASTWALYKTYTLLTMEQNLTDVEQLVNRKGNKGRFVIRGCYSCHYWACQREVEKFMRCNSLKIPADIAGLNGRYDFSIELKEESFYHIYEEVINYKSGDGNTDLNRWQNYQEEGESFLVFLLQNDYISYLNERYLLPAVKEEENQSVLDNNISRVIYLDAKREQLPSLMDENKKQIDDLKGKYLELSGKIDRILSMHQNGQQFFRLLETHIMSCYTLNQQPDTRVFVVDIGEQLETVLNAMDVYYRLYEKSKNQVQTELADLIVDYMREAVYAIDNYLEHIRNNNLQSLQTPNYNIESKMGMEKVLIGYSEYLWRVMDYYQKEVETKKKEFCPIVIPDLNKLDICVEVLFPEGNGEQWKDEKDIRESNVKYSQYLLTIDSPTLAELGDLPIFMAMLFHEIAHQFRYESRVERNKTLVSIIVRESMKELVVGVLGKVERTIGKNENKQDLRDMLIEVFTMVTIEWIEKKRYFGEDMDVPLNYFIINFCSKFEEFKNAWIREENIQEKVAQYIKEIQSATDVCQGEGLNFVKLLHDFMDKQSDILTIQKAVFALTWWCAYQKLESGRDDIAREQGWLLKVEDVRQWCESQEPWEYMELWNPICLAAQGEQQKEIGAIWRCFDSFAHWVEDYLEWTKEKDGKSDRIKDFMNLLYQRTCEKWNEMNEEYDKIGKDSYSVLEQQSLLNRYRSWILMGRYLGIDTTRKVDRFTNTICSYIDYMGGDSVKAAVALYREITSDIFMYCIMDLSPFEYLKLVTMIISEADLIRWFNIKRVVSVIYVMGSTQDEKTSMDQYWAACQTIWEEIINFYQTMFNVAGNETTTEYLCEIKEAQEEEIFAQILRNIEKFQEMLRQVTENERGDKLDVLRHIEKMVKVFDRIVRQGKYYIMELRENPECLEDYQKGVKEQRQMRKKMEQSQEMFVNELLYLCSLSKEYIHKKHHKTGVVNDEKLNKESIEFLLSMYYNRKIRNTRKSRSEEEG